MLTAALAAIIAMALLAGVFFVEQARRWRRISARPENKMWSPFAREIARAAAGGQVRYAWCAIGLGWIALVALLLDGGGR